MYDVLGNNSSSIFSKLQNLLNFWYFGMFLFVFLMYLQATVVPFLVNMSSRTTPCIGFLSIIVLLGTLCHTRFSIPKSRYKLPYPASSPYVGLFKNGTLVHFLERHHIEGRTADMIAENLADAFDEYC